MPLSAHIWDSFVKTTSTLRVIAGPRERLIQLRLPLPNPLLLRSLPQLRKRPPRPLLKRPQKTRPRKRKPPSNQKARSQKERILEPAAEADSPAEEAAEEESASEESEESDDSAKS